MIRGAHYHWGGRVSVSNESYITAGIAAEDLTGHDVLLARIRSCPGRQWVSDYFDLVGEIIRAFEIANGDPRLVMSMPKGGSLPIIINQRYVIRGPRSGKVGLIMPCWYNPGPDEEVHPDYYFSKMHVREALWVEFPIWDRMKLPERTKTCWKMAVEEELRRGSRSSYRRFHQPVVFMAVVNHKYRGLLLDQAFPQSSPAGHGTK